MSPRSRARPATRWLVSSPGRKPLMVRIRQLWGYARTWDRTIGSGFPPDPLALALRSAMRLPARLMIAALVLAVGGSIGGCSAGAGTAYAGDSSRPPGVVAAGSAAAAAASA